MPQRTWSLILAGILLVAFVLRVLGLGWGLPFVYHPDEPTHVGIVLNILKTGDFNPHWFKYPSFRVYVSLPVAIVYFLAAVAKGKFTSVQQMVPAKLLITGSGTTEIASLYYGLRLWMALFGLAGVGYLYYWARKNFNERVAFFSALFLAISPVHVLVSHWYRPDTILALFCGAGVFAAVQLYRKDEWRMYAICGFWVGLAASVKYNAMALQFLPVLLAHLLARRKLLDWRLGLAALVAVLTFLMITPYALFDLPAFLDGFAFEIAHYYVRGHPGADVTGGYLENLAWYIGKLTSYDGLLVLLAAAAPFLIERARRKEALVLVSWPVCVLLLDTSAKVRTVLALVPMFLVLYLLAAVTFDKLISLIGGRWGFKAGRWVSSIGTIALLALPVVRTYRMDSYFLQPDVRTLAKCWLEEHLQPETRVGLESYGPVLERPGAIYSFRLIEHSLEWYQAAGVEYLVASNYAGMMSTPERYPKEVAAYQQLFALPLVATIEGPRQDIYDPPSKILIYRVPLPTRYELPMSERFAPWLESGFYEPEDIGGHLLRWTADRAKVKVRLKTGGEYVFRVRGRGWRPQEVEAAHMTISLDGMRLGEHTWARGDEEWLVRFRLPGESTPSEVFKEFLLETNTWRPSEILGTKDERSLGVLLETIIIEEVPPS